MIVIVVAFVLATLALIGVTLARAWTQQRRIGARLGAISAHLAASGSTDPRSTLLDALKGERAPGFALPGLDGERVTLDALLADGKPLLLVFAEPRCGPCYEILPDLGGWQRVYGDHLAMALVSSGAEETNVAMTSPYGIAPVLLQHKHEVAIAYELAQEPAAVLIQPDGRISAGPRYGTRAIRELVANTLGLALPPAPVDEVVPVGIGDAVPALRRPDLRGNLVDLAASRGAPSLVLFWSPGCSHCQALVPAILAAERHPTRPHLTIVSRGPAGLTAAAGFASPVVFDDDRSIARTFAVEATPSAVIIDGQGRIATPVVRGEPILRALLDRIAPPPATPATKPARPVHMNAREQPHGATA